MKISASGERITTHTNEVDNRNERARMRAHAAELRDQARAAEATDVIALEAEQRRVQADVRRAAADTAAAGDAEVAGRRRSGRVAAARKTRTASAKLRPTRHNAASQHHTAAARLQASSKVPPTTAEGRKPLVDEDEDIFDGMQVFAVSAQVVQAAQQQRDNKGPANLTRQTNRTPELTAQSVQKCNAADSGDIFAGMQMVEQEVKSTLGGRRRRSDTDDTQRKTMLRSGRWRPSHVPDAW